MIKQIKLGKVVLTNIEPYETDENGNKVWNIPNDLEELRKITIDTFNWLISLNVKKQTGDVAKLNAANSKAIALLTKVIMSLNPDTNNLTELEKSALDKINTLAQQGYADSELLNNSLDAVLNNITIYSQKIDQAIQATSVDELIKLLSE